jgi:hypothetical protein
LLLSSTAERTDRYRILVDAGIAPTSELSLEPLEDSWPSARGALTVELRPGAGTTVVAQVPAA